MINTLVFIWHRTEVNEFATADAITSIDEPTTNTGDYNDFVFSWVNV